VRGSSPARPDDLEVIMQLQRAFQVEYYRTTSDLEEEFAGMALERMAGGVYTRLARACPCCARGCLRIKKLLS
jgi:hypothetical protein